MRTLYRVLFWLALPFALFRVIWRALRQPDYLKNLPERFGFAPAAYEENPIWIHAVSVGETRAAEPLIRALRAKHPNLPVLLTCTTPTGRTTGEQLFGSDVRQLYLPYDLTPAVRRFLRIHRPKMGILMETELWPELILACKAQSIPVYLINARLSERSARRYGLARSLFSTVLDAITSIGAQSESDATRLQNLGAARVSVCGNLKFDRSAAPSDFALAEAFRQRIGSRRVLLVASTRSGEEALVLDAWKQAPHDDVLLVLVPRHPQRFHEVANLIEKRALSFQRRSSNAPVHASTEVWLGDSMGEMFAFYLACDVAAIGGSFLEFGGQNLLEACAVGKPAIVGPHMFNFAEATQLALTAGAALQVTSANEAITVALELLHHPHCLQTLGEAGRTLMHAHQGATQRVLDVLGL